MGARILRLRTLIADNLSLVVLALAVLGLIGGAVTHATYVDPGTRTEHRQVSSWESAGEFFHRATVQNGSGPFPAGAILHNRSVYYRRVTPVLNGSFAYRYAATDGGDLTANATLSLVLRSAEEDRRGNETVYWRVERSLGTASAESLAPGERLAVPFSTNATAVLDRADAIEKLLGGTPGRPELALVGRVNLTGTRNGRPVEASRVYRVPIRSRQGIYQVTDPGAVTESGERTREVAVPAAYGPLRGIGGPLLLGASVAGLVGLLAARRTGRVAVPEPERDWLAYRADRAEFDDWITTGRVADRSARGVSVETDSLEGLIDAAADTDGRVVEDGAGDRFVVFGDGVRYVYEPPPPPGRAAGEGSADAPEPEAQRADD